MCGHEVRFNMDNRIAAFFMTLVFAGLALTGIAADKPNIVLVMVDDMGYSDLGCFGSEIKTPNIDRLAEGGITFTQFTNCAKCETTRATLMSGRYHTEARSGKGVITIPENLALGGYQNFMVGKWHIFGSPSTRGFDRWYGFPNGACNFFNCESTGTPKMMLTEDDKSIPLPDGFYSTRNFTDHAVTYIEERDKEKPFFMYVAYNAPHYPLQAPKDEVMKYRGKYREGWEVLRAARLAGLKSKGIVPADQAMSRSSQESWDDLSDADQDRQDLLMATYAAMIDIVDQNVGRLVATLKSEGVYEDTLIIFLSDNGACPFDRTTKVTLENNYMPWDERSFYCYTASWANACNTPFKLYKQNQNEGGISTAMIAHWPTGIKAPKRFDRERAHLVDLHATFLDLAGVEYPTEYKGQPVGEARGLSLAKAFQGEQRPVHHELYYKFGQKYSALWQKEWKLVDERYLYRIGEDRIEQNDLAAQYPEKTAEMKKRWAALHKSLGGRTNKARK